MGDDAGGCTVAIAGGGIAGLLLALALKRLLGLDPVVFEKASGYADEVGGAIGLYPNGLRVLRDVSPDLFEIVRCDGCAFGVRRFMRHDGSDFAVGDEARLADAAAANDSESGGGGGGGGGSSEELEPMGIRRWRLLRALADACDDEGIEVRFGSRVVRAVVAPASSAAGGEDGEDADVADGPITLELASGDVIEADIVFACDGIKSAVRRSLFPDTDADYTGVTCLMGASAVPRTERGICYPTSSRSAVHACYYATGPSEQVFQIFAVAPEQKETWRALTPDEGRQECLDLAEKM
ncbi:hypothetical protein HK405_001289, partial [Cladochytrium tenue]